MPVEPHRKSNHPFWHCGLLALLVVSIYVAPAYAELAAIAKKETLIYAEPGTETKPIARLRNLTHVTVLGKQGADWFKIRIALKDGKELLGWTLKTNVYSPDAGSKLQKREEQNLLENLINTRSRSQQPPEPSKETKKTRSIEETSTVSSTARSLIDRLTLGTAIGYRVNSYEVSDASNSIAYDIPALFFGVHGQFDFYQHHRWSAGVRGSFEYEMRNYTAELFDDAATPQLISSTDATGTGIGINFALAGSYAFSDGPTAATLHLLIGYLSTSTSMEDSSFHNLPMALFVNSDYTHWYIGPEITIPFSTSDTIAGLHLSGHYFLASDFSESTDSSAGLVTGQTVEATPGYFLKAGFFWNFTPHLIAEFAYIRKQEGADFTGAGARLNDTSQVVNFTNASVDETFNGGVLEVAYDF